MREIKFRGLTKRNEWVYGSLVNTTRGVIHMPKQHTKTWIVTEALGNGGWFAVGSRYYVLPNTVGQYTGLKDKNSIEIYEGDIVIADQLRLNKVVGYSTDLAVFMASGLHPYAEKVLLCDFEFEIVGNVYENPELLNN